jgi:hypothetical protein
MEVQNEELLIVEAGGTYNYHWASKGRFLSPRNYAAFPFQSSVFLTMFRKLWCYSKSQIKPINGLCGQCVELLNVKASGTHSYHYPVKCY